MADSLNDKVASDDDDAYVNGDSDSPYNLYNPLNPDTVIERIRYRQETRHTKDDGRPKDIHGSPIRLSSISVGVEVSRACMCAEWTLIGVLICVVWLLLMVPTAFYIRTHIMSAGTSSNDSTSHDANSTCSPVIYTGEACRDWLLPCQNGFTDSSITSSSDSHSVIYIPSSIDQSVWEERASFFLQYRSVLPSTCRDKLVPFLCLYFFGLCDKEKNVTFKPSMDDCVQLRDDLCKEKWKLAARLLPDLIPVCENLPHQTETVGTCNFLNNSQNLQNPSCKDNFFYDQEAQLCQPECGIWSPYSDLMNKISDGLIISVVIFAIITCLVVLVLGCLRCRRVFVFPTILVIYQTFSVLVFAVIVLIGYTSRTSLFCSSRNLMSSILKPTPFCIVSGIVLYYIMMQLVILWLFQVMFVFWGTWWPMNARRFLLSGKGHCLHAILIHLGLFLPIIPVLVVGLTEGFTLTRLPPIVCAGPHVHGNFFSMILPICIMIAAGSSLLILIMREVIKKHVIAKIRGQRMKLVWWSSEIKVLIVICYYIILGVVVLTSLTIAMANLKQFFEEITDYFDCESQPQLLDGNVTTNSTDCNRSSLERLINPIPTTISFMLIGIYPAVNLVYTWNFKELKDKWKSRHVQYVNRHSSVRFSKEAVRATIRHPHSFSGAPHIQ